MLISIVNIAGSIYSEIGTFFYSLSPDSGKYYSLVYKMSSLMLERQFLISVPGLKDKLSTKRDLKLTVNGFSWNSKLALAVANHIILLKKATRYVSRSFL